MRVLILMLLLAFLPAQAYASDKCITIDGKVYCQAQQEITLGGVKLKVTDPADILRKAKQTKGNLKRTGLYDDYHYLPVIEALASQNDMSYHIFIDHMILYWETDVANPFETIRDFEEIYDEIPAEYKPTVISGIANKVAADVEDAIYTAFGYGDLENV